MNRLVCVFFGVVLLVITWVPSLSAPAIAVEIDQADLTADQHKGDRLVERLGITETLGPLAPVALSPFFGLACLSGTSILCDKGILPENEFLTGNDVLNNGWVFLIFLGLTVITSAPRLVTASKIFAEATDRIETYAGIISYAVILMFAQQDSSADQIVVYSAGFFSMTGNGLLACCAAVNIFVISSVRFFFELLILISPIPTLDAIFECTNKAVAGILATIYAFNPWLAFVLNVILFLICLTIFKWTNRRIRYLKALILEPVMLGFVRKFLGHQAYDSDRKAQRHLSADIADVSLAVKCFPSKKLGKIKTKDLCYLVFTPAGPSLIKPRLFRSAIISTLDSSSLSKQVTEGVMSYSITLAPHGGRKECELIFGNVYKHKLDTIRLKLSELTSLNPTS
jgi:hypothetical protein